MILVSDWVEEGGALSVLKFIWLYQMYSVSSSSILSALPFIVNNNDRYKMKAPLILVYSYENVNHGLKFEKSKISTSL